VLAYVSSQINIADKNSVKLKKYNKDDTFKTIARPYNNGPPNKFRHQQHTKNGKYARGNTM
jgi:hypothetical protein